MHKCSYFTNSAIQISRKFSFDLNHSRNGTYDQNCTAWYLLNRWKPDKKGTVLHHIYVALRLKARYAIKFMSIILITIVID